ncbi:MAG: hypothetical protein P8Y25_16070 [Chromatiaceae bacterium]
MADIDQDLFRACKASAWSGRVDQDLFRACKASAWSGRGSEGKSRTFLASHGAGSLYPDYDGFRRRDGSFRAPDITTMNDTNGVTWVKGVNEEEGHRRPYRNEGVSLSTEPGKFGYSGWLYFLLPTGTPIPDSLDVAQTGADRNHYSLRCLNRMRRDAYEGALDTLARAAIAKAVELRRQSLSFSA